MTIYDVLVRLVEARPFQDFERAEALELLKDAERLNVFGTLAKQMNEGHEHDWLKLSANWRKCKVCSLEEPIFGNGATT